MRKSSKKFETEAIRTQMERRGNVDGIQYQEIERRWNVDAKIYNISLTFEPPIN